MNLNKNMKIALFLLIYLATFSISGAKQSKSISEMLDQFLNSTVQWRINQRAEFQEPRFKFSTRAILAGSLCSAAASISSAGGIGGGGLFIPILTIVAEFDLKTASSFSAFMVTGGSISNVLSYMFKINGDKSLIDYDVTLLSEPCMLLGVSIGVICNLIFPEWLITVLFAAFLAWSTFKTFKSGVAYWRLESEGIRRSCCQKLENGVGENDIREESEGNIRRVEEPLLQKETRRKLELPWGKLGMLAVIWFSFFVLYLLRGNRDGQGIIPIRSCGVGYWIISAAQVPLAIILTSWLLYRKDSICNQQELGSDTKSQGRGKLIFPTMAFLAGALGGVFGIGGGMLISPLLLQTGMAPEVTAATCSLMVFFSSTMSAFQYILLGMDHIEAAVIFAVACFLGSVIGLVIVQRAIERHGRATLIVFSVGLVLALSTVLMTSFGAVDVWHDYKTGAYMGFKQPC